MKKFIYVQALINRSDAVSFRHTVVEARDTDDAYDIGGDWADTQPLSFDTEPINDYVIELPQ